MANLAFIGNRFLVFDLVETEKTGRVTGNLLAQAKPSVASEVYFGSSLSVFLRCDFGAAFSVLGDSSFGRSVSVLHYVCLDS